MKQGPDDDRHEFARDHPSPSCPPSRARRTNAATRADHANADRSVRRRRGDFNPIHDDEEFARSAGFPTVLSMGLLQGGMLGCYAARWLGLANLRQFEIRFTGQVWPGDDLTITGVVERVYTARNERLADCAFTVTRKTGETVLSGTATAVTSR